ncbi:TcmI family type II polyketide cyclase [Streptomyces triticagri]|uniref:TcmI family type II polyketide cyclase n=1 Tax=Streptomyces triticagri TaxID=2293568 RepID=A0A372LZL6_9ACTN|nr:TcmI family type II polyketide cyclase [Streptomyces triticagri]RFU83715.1 TcmI family type II polyketide cyclase [Streptomyces triticagri]
MAHRTLIVARMEHDDADKVAALFAESDATELPHLIGVQRRTLFRFHGLYFHLVEAEAPINSDLYKARSNPLYQDINTRLQEFMTPYDASWREPKDSMAESFYSWTP